jgi:hypothetical protein
MHLSKLIMRFSFTLFVFILSVSILLGCKKNKSSSTNGTCSDGILNQNETAIDCGGVCSVCQTCSDGIQNQGETGIDCGGPCVPCNEPITYSEFGTYGYNLLHIDTVQFIKSTVVYPINMYTLRSQVPEGKRLRVLIEKVTGTGIWVIANGFYDGWNVGIYNNNSQDFSTVGKVTTDVRLNFSDKGAAKIKIYENGDTLPTREKFIIWQ